MSHCTFPRTTYQFDYHRWQVEPRKKICPTPITKLRARSKYRPVQMDLEIMQPFKPDVDVPFNLFHRKNEVTQINPHLPIPNIKLEDKMFELKIMARRERPSIYMVPQICLDDVPEDVMYGESGLVSSIYSSDWQKACTFAIENSPLKPQKCSKDVIFEKKDLIDKSIEKTRPSKGETLVPMEIGLSKCIADWEKQNPVEFVDTTKLFWEKNSSRGLCSVCDSQPVAEGISNKDKAEIEACLKEDSLRAPYALHPVGYTGYIPKLARGIELRKKLLSKNDPFVTTYMESQGVYKK